jgi:hypothetical protein
MRFIWNRNKSKSILFFFSTRKWPALPVLLLFCLYNIPPWLVYAQRIILVWTKQIILNTKSRQVSRNRDFCCCCGGLRDLGLNQSKRFAICFCVFDGFIWLPWVFSLGSQRCYDWRIWWWWNNHVRSSPPPPIVTADCCVLFIIKARKTIQQSRNRFLLLFYINNFPPFIFPVWIFVFLVDQRGSGAGLHYTAALSSWPSGRG